MLNLLSEETRRNPFPVYDRIRAASPLLHDPRTGLWMIFDYEGVKRALNDHDAFSSSPMTANHPHPKWLIFTDPPRHSSLRALVNRAFTPRMIANLEPRIQELSRGLLDPLMDRGEVDIASEFAVPLPMMVIARMVGVPASDWLLFRRWSDAILQLSYSVFDAGEEAAATKNAFSIREEMTAYLADLIAVRRSAPKDDLLTNLVLAEVDGERLEEVEIVAFVQLLLIAGHETTTNLIDNAILCLMEHPDECARLRTAPALLPLAIEEVLRYRSPVQFTYRATKRDVSMHGQTIPAGKLVIVLIGSANRDPRQFPEPARFDIGRDPNPHVAFGHGIHFCLGAPLSRLEARIALTDILERMKSFEPASSEPWEPRRALNVHGPNRLPIRFESTGRVRKITAGLEP